MLSEPIFTPLQSAGKDPEIQHLEMHVLWDSRQVICESFLFGAGIRQHLNLSKVSAHRVTLKA